MKTKHIVLSAFFTLHSSLFTLSTVAQQLPIMGWSSWNTYHVNISEELIKKQADAIVSTGLKDMGYTYINIDDGFYGTRDAQGKMHQHPTRFPNGMRVVSDYIHSLGLRAGIYAEAGNNTCGSIYDNDSNGVGAGLYGYEQQDMELYLREWNYDFIKIDYCGGKRMKLDEREQYTKIVNAIRKTGRKDASINICRWAFPGTWAKDLARSWRISSDIRPRWKSVKSIIAKTMYLSAFATDGHYNDMDMLEVGRGMKPEEDITHFGMWCILSSPLLIGCDLTKIKPATLALLKNKELISLNQDPLCLQAHVAWRQDDHVVFVKDLEKRQGKVRAVAFYNAADTAYEFHIPLPVLSLGGKTKVRDLVYQKNLPEVTDTCIYKVAPHATHIVRMEAAHRLEETRYEAEWAYLPLYDDLVKRKEIIRYARAATCSGGMKIAYLGNAADNYARWSEVYSKKGGKYEMTIYFMCDTDRPLELTVNGKQYDFAKLNSGGKDKVAALKLEVTLKKGYNDIRMGATSSWAPDIDCFVLNKK